MDQSSIESLLWDCVSGDTGDDAPDYDYQSPGIDKLAALLVEYDRRIVELEKKVAELTEARTPTPDTEQ